MLSSLLRPRKARQRVEEHSPFSSPYPGPDQSSPIVARRERQIRHATADWTETEADDDVTEDDEDEDHRNHGEEEPEEEDEDAQENDAEDGGEDGEDTPLLPIFSAAHLGQYRSLEAAVRTLTNSKQTLSLFTTSLMRFDSSSCPRRKRLCLGTNFDRHKFLNFLSSQCNSKFEPRISPARRYTL
jgi:hypothetical protein